MILHLRSKDLTAFLTLLELLRNITLLQGAINSMTQFVKIINLILKDIYLAIAMSFLDDIEVKGPYIDYDDKEVILRIQKYIFEHI